VIQLNHGTFDSTWRSHPCCFETSNDVLIAHPTLSTVYFWHAQHFNFVGNSEDEEDMESQVNEQMMAPQAHPTDNQQMMQFILIQLELSQLEKPCLIRKIADMPLSIYCFILRSFLCQSNKFFVFISRRNTCSIHACFHTNPQEGLSFFFLDINFSMVHRVQTHAECTSYGPLGVHMLLHHNHSG
jgi:hypothetical protein